jgi:hypothetical protein
MSAANMTYGVEIECGIDSAVNLRIGSYHYGAAVSALPDFDGRSWKAESDGSLSFTDRRPVEFVSPILKGAEGLDNIRAACAQIKAWGGKTNRTCGLHIHVGVGDISIDALRRLYRLVGRFEDALYAVTGTPERRSSHYCQPIKTQNNRDMNWQTLADKSDIRYASQARDLRDRYRILNIVNMINGRQDTVEFRVFSGSLNPAKISAWVQVCLSLVQCAIDGWDADWDISLDILSRRKYGATFGVKNTRYMCEFLWKWPSRKALGYGDVGHATFTRDAAQRTLLSLAERFDTRSGNTIND